MAFFDRSCMIDFLGGQIAISSYVYIYVTALVSGYFVRELFSSLIFWS